MRLTTRLVYFLISASLMISCGRDAIVRLVQNVDLEKKGIVLKFNNVPTGLYAQPFVIDFSRALFNYSYGEVLIEAYNAYIVGNMDKISEGSIPGVSNFIDPTGKFKDAWFGVYIVIDDPQGKGKRFFLNKIEGGPGEENKYKVRSILLLPEIDQKVIVWSTHQNHRNYGMRDYINEFYFYPRKGAEIKKEIVTDRKKRKWFKITGKFNTVSALTDTSKTDMKLLSSIRIYIGLPNAEVYKLVDPWHPMVLKGSIYTRYFQRGNVKFWAVVYYNSSAFVNKKGEQIDNWENTDIQKVFAGMFESLQIDCIKK